MYMKDTNGLLVTLYVYVDREGRINMYPRDSQEYNARWKALKKAINKSYVFNYHDLLKFAARKKLPGSQLDFDWTRALRRKECLTLPLVFAGRTQQKE